MLAPAYLLLTVAFGLAGAPCSAPQDQDHRPAPRQHLFHTASLQFGQRPGPTPEEREKARLRIGISAQQQQKIEALFKRFEPVRSQYRQLSRQLWDEYRKWDFDPHRTADLRRQMLQLQKQMSDIRADNEVQLRHILSHDQFDRMQQMIQEGRQRHRGPRGGGPPGPA